MNHLADIYEIQYEHYALRYYSGSVFLSVLRVGNDMAIQWNFEVGTALAPCILMTNDKMYSKNIQNVFRQNWHGINWKRDGLVKVLTF